MSLRPPQSGTSGHTLLGEYILDVLFYLIHPILERTYIFSESLHQFWDFFLPPKNSGTIKAMSSTSYIPIPPINNNLVIAILILGLHPPTHGCSYHLRGSTVCRCASGFRDRRSSMQTRCFLSNFHRMWRKVSRSCP